eukprot:XP_011616943.1 PREDICTED: cell growth regulator with RING finger domain protein 1-like [Takifugu rubripes]
MSRKSTSFLDALNHTVGFENSSLDFWMSRPRGPSNDVTPVSHMQAAHVSALFFSLTLPFIIGSEDAQECLTQIPACQGVTDFGPLPRARYPLVAVLTLAEPAGRHIAASINIIHVPDSKYSSAARIIFQYLLTSQGNIYELKSLFMSADGGQVGQAPSRDQSLRDGQPSEEATPAPSTRQEVEGCRDCVVCQSAAVSIVLLPCRHACVCDSCVAHFQHCPICRAFVLESFTLTGNQQPRWAHIR